MPILSLIAVATILQTQSAPVDVPKDHWAFPAVDTLFREGLLKGYPVGKQPALVLDRNAKRDDKKLKAWMSDWKVRGLLVGYPDDPYHFPPDNPYLWAVSIHAMWSNLTWDSDANRRHTDPTPDSLSCFPRLAQAISMLEPELTKLGADVPQMIAELNRLRTGTHLESLKLDKSIKQDLKQAEVWVREWKAKGLLIGFHLDHYGRGRELSNYELAVATYHASMESMENSASRSSDEVFQNRLDELPNMAKAISMFREELVKLGANPDQMIARVNDLYQSQYRLFDGDR